MGYDIVDVAARIDNTFVGIITSDGTCRPAIVTVLTFIPALAMLDDVILVPYALRWIGQDFAGNGGGGCPHRPCG